MNTKCPNCHQTYECDESMRNSEITCQKCGMDFIIQEAMQEDEPIALGFGYSIKNGVYSLTEPSEFSCFKKIIECKKPKGYIYYNKLLRVAGIKYYREDFIKAVSRNKVVFGMQLDPDNPEDHNAIKIMANGYHIGYVDRITAAMIANQGVFHDLLFLPRNIYQEKNTIVFEYFLVTPGKRLKESDRVINIIAKVDSASITKLLKSLNPMFPVQNNTIDQEINKSVHLIYSSPKRRWIYIMLALFLGLFGIHNFYARRIFNGILQLLLTLSLIGIIITIIWVIADIRSIKQDGRGIPFLGYEHCIQSPQKWGCFQIGSLIFLILLLISLIVNIIEKINEPKRQPQKVEQLKK